jgi:hypothetical protein
MRFAKCCYGDKIKEDEVVIASNTYGTDEKWIQNFYLNI